MEKMEIRDISRIKEEPHDSCGSEELPEKSTDVNGLLSSTSQDVTVKEEKLSDDNEGTQKAEKRAPTISITSLINDPRIQNLLTEGVGSDNSRLESLGTNVVVNEDMMLVLQTLKPKPSTDDGLIFKVVPLQYFGKSSSAPLRPVGRRYYSQCLPTSRGSNLITADLRKPEGEQDVTAGDKECQGTSAGKGDSRVNFNISTGTTEEDNTGSSNKFCTIPYKMVNVDPSHHSNKKLRASRSARPLNKMSKCDVCGSTFMHRSGLSRHKRIMHRGLKYSCPYCGELFTRTDSLQDHARRQHPGRVADLVPMGSYRAIK